MCALEIYDFHCSITHEKPDHGVCAQVNVITRFEKNKSLLDLMKCSKFCYQFDMYLRKIIV